MSESRIKVDVTTEFFCTTCGKKTKRIDSHQIEFFVNSRCALPTRPEHVFLKQICPLCYSEIKELQDMQKAQHPDLYAALEKAK